MEAISFLGKWEVSLSGRRRQKWGGGVSGTCIDIEQGWEESAKDEHVWGQHSGPG